MLVQVAYANKIKQYIFNLNIDQNSTVLDVIKMSKINEYCHEIDINNIESLTIGIFGKKIDINTYQLQENDRIEIYRPLLKTPNQRRLERINNK